MSEALWNACTLREQDLRFYTEKRNNAATCARATELRIKKKVNWENSTKWHTVSCILFRKKLSEFWSRKARHVISGVSNWYSQHFLLDRQDIGVMQIREPVVGANRDWTFSKRARKSDIVNRHFIWKTRPLFSLLFYRARTS